MARLATELHKYSPEAWFTKQQAQDHMKQHGLHRPVTAKMCKECRIQVNSQGYIMKDSLNLYIRDEETRWAEVDGTPQAPFLPAPVLRYLIVVKIIDCVVTHEQGWITTVSNNLPYTLHNFVPFFLRDDFQELTVKLDNVRYLVYKGTMEPAWVQYMEQNFPPVNAATIGPDDIDNDIRRILFPEEEEKNQVAEPAQELPGGGYIL